MSNPKAKGQAHDEKDLVDRIADVFASSLNPIMKSIEEQTKAIRGQSDLFQKQVQEQTKAIREQSDLFQKQVQEQTKAIQAQSGLIKELSNSINKNLGVAFSHLTVGGQNELLVDFAATNMIQETDDPVEASEEETSDNIFVKAMRGRHKDYDFIQFKWTKETEAAQSKRAMAHVTQELGKLGVNFGKGGYTFVDATDHGKSALSFELKGKQYNGCCDGAIIPFKLFAAMYPWHSRAIFDWKPDISKKNLPQQIAELIGITLKSSHPVISIQTDLQSFFCIMICLDTIHLWESTDCSRAMRFIAYWLSEVCTPDLTFSYKDANPDAAQGLRQQAIRSFKTLKEKYESRSSSSELHDQLALADDMSPIEGFRYTVELIAPYIQNSMFS